MDGLTATETPAAPRKEVHFLSDSFAVFDSSGSTHVKGKCSCGHEFDAVPPTYAALLRALVEHRRTAEKG